MTLVTTRGRHLVALTLAVVVALASGEAGSSPRSPAPLLDQVNALRRQVGLAPLKADPVVRLVVERMAVGDLTDRAPEVLDAQPDCAVCDLYFEGGAARDPTVHYHALGGRSLIRFALWRAGWTASANLSVFFRAAALVLDPRARTFAAARTPLGMLVVGVTADSRGRFDRPVRWPLGVLDPTQQLWAHVLLPPGQGYPKLYDMRGGKEVTVAYPLATFRGLGGSRLVAFGLTTSLAYDRAYHVGAPRLGVRLRTRPAPAAFLRRSWTFHSVEPAERAVFLDAVRQAPAQLRALLAELDGAVDVIGGSEACLSVDACEEVDGDRAKVGIATTATRAVILHELGHVIFDLALDERGRRAFRSAFIRTGWRNAPYVPPGEQFADQLEHWALGEPADDPRWLRPADLSRMLREHAAYRPLSARGVLPR
jgi:hypothetical protein